MHENNRIEYKQKVTPELEKEVVAFLNSNEGGVIHIFRKFLANYFTSGGRDSIYRPSYPAG